MSSKKIVVIGKKNYLHWDDHVVDGFCAQGCEVHHFQSNDRPLPLQMARGLLKVFRGSEQAKSIANLQHAKYLVRQIKTINPDLIFFTSGVLIALEYFQVMRELLGKPIIAAWDGDGAPGYESTRKYLPYIDHFFETDLHYVTENKLGFAQMHHLPFCANPKIHRNGGKLREDKLYFCGGWTLARDQILSGLDDYPILLKGWHWDRLSKQGHHLEVVPGTVSIEQQVEDYNRYQFVLNSHQVENNHHGALNMRTFEAPACGATLLCDDREELPLMFDVDSEIMVYRSVEELRELLHRCKQDPTYATRVAEKGYRRVMAHHTYAQRMKSVLKTLF